MREPQRNRDHSAIPHLIFHFFTEYNAPRRWPSGMLVADKLSGIRFAKRSGVFPLLVGAYVEATNGFDPGD